ncbi:hypothetical protein H5410_002391 [Solanum commersonii]|uniref:Uncharacterized protein n=1 Tax=Solanum commersonii TaxID=4109 RepID=A0A9J6B271_SOLCO|nr:hypothetical protein H5410_002391 [Solanum commersonii]
MDKRQLIHSLLFIQVSRDYRKLCVEFAKAGLFKKKGHGVMLLDEYQCCLVLTSCFYTCVGAKCGRNHPRACHDGSNVCFKCGQTCHFMREYPNNRHGNDNGGNKPQSFQRLWQIELHLEELPGIGGGTNHLYAITR